MAERCLSTCDWLRFDICLENLGFVGARQIASADSFTYTLQPVARRLCIDALPDKRVALGPGYQTPDRIAKNIRVPHPIEGTEPKSGPPASLLGCFEQTGQPPFSGCDCQGDHALGAVEALVLLAPVKL